ncbi:uncharacterized protein V6R79_013508 [Siganus canaliculatus]
MQSNSSTSQRVNAVWSTWTWISGVSSQPSSSGMLPMLKLECHWTSVEEKEVGPVLGQRSQKLTLSSSCMRLTSVRVLSWSRGEMRGTALPLPLLPLPLPLPLLPLPLLQTP